MLKLFLITILALTLLTNTLTTNYGCALATTNICNNQGKCEDNGNCICNFGYTGVSCEVKLTAVTIHNGQAGKGTIFVIVFFWLTLPFFICFVWYVCYVRCMDKEEYDDLKTELCDGCCCYRNFLKFFCSKCCFSCCKKCCKRNCACCFPPKDPNTSKPHVVPQEV